MATLTLRNTKGIPLTNAEVDNNFQNLNNALGAAGSSTIPTPSGTGSPVLTTSPSINTPTLNSPILVTPAIGTPASGNLTNCTGLPVASGVSGLATGISTFLTTPSSANLLSAMTTKTGTGSLVFNTNTTLAGTTSADSLTLNSPLAIASGGTNASDRATALSNLLPSASGVTPGYVLATSGPGTYYWAAGGSGGGTVGSGGGTSVQTSRKIVTATSGQTVFTGLGAYTPNIGQLRVYINGVRQFPSDYTEDVTTLSSVVITGTAGQFSCASTTITNGQTISITGIFGGTGSITNYISGKLYYVIATNGTTTFTLSETLGGTAITTTTGTPTGLTYTTGYGFTLTSGATAGEVVMAEVDSYYSYVQLAASTTYSASGALTANNVQNAIDQLETNKLAKAGGTMTGGLTLFAGTTSSPALKLTTGVTLTSATSGAVEWDGLLLYITNSSNTRKTLAYVDNTHYIGTTSIALNRTSASQTLTGVSIDGSAVSVTGSIGSSVTATTQAVGDSSTKVATTEFVYGQSFDRMVLETAKAYNWNGLSTNTYLDFTSIPSWVKRITVMFNGVSTNGSSIVQVQVGSGSISATGYAANVGNTTSASLGTQAITTGFGLNTNSVATDLRSGIMTLTLIGSNTWVCNSLVGITNTTNTGFGGGVSPALAGTLDRIRITTVNGTDAFDVGSINILYEGY